MKGITYLPHVEVEKAPIGATTWYSQRR